MTIFYVCEPCQDGAPEGCGYEKRNDLRVMPNGAWICQICFDLLENGEYGVEIPDSEFKPGWADFPMPPEYVPK